MYLIILNYILKWCLKNYLFTFFFWLCWVFVAVWTSCSCGEWGCSLVAARWLLVTVASFAETSSGCVDFRSCGSWALSTGAVAVLRPSCSEACGIFPDQGLNPCLLHCQADSLPLDHQGSPEVICLSVGLELGFFLYFKENHVGDEWE